MAVAEIAERLRSVRENLGLTQVEFAEQIGAQLRTYKRWEQGHSELPASAFFAIETAFNVSSKWLFTGQGLIMGRNPPARPIDDDQAHGIANAACWCMCRLARTRAEQAFSCRDIVEFIDGKRQEPSA